MKFYIKIFGCQYNEWDAAKISLFLQNFGLIESDKSGADVVFILNCSVRKTAVDRALSWAKNCLEENKIVVITGCVLENDKKRFTQKKAFVWDGLDLTQLAEILKLKISNDKIDQLKNSRVISSNFIPIMKGCDNLCSYCAVPYTRGREVSRPFNEIISDVKAILEKGKKEIWLLGQNVNSYQSKNQESRIMDHATIVDFAKLLQKINDLPGDFVIHFTSNHPKDMTDEIIETIAQSDKIAKEIHLPLQSGSNKILKAMNRPYTKEQYLELIDKVKKEIPNVKITTDSIVGFPGENEDDFQETVEVFKAVNFFQAYNNKYSPREGTAAFKLGDPIPWKEKERRWRILNDLVYKK